MWLILVEFHSASSEIGGQKNEERKKEYVVKYKSADMYVVWPNNLEVFGIALQSTLMQSKTLFGY